PPGMGVFVFTLWEGLSERCLTESLTVVWVAVKRVRSYAWAFHVEAGDRRLGELSAAALAGLGYARELAEDALLRRGQNINGRERFAALTVDELAAVHGERPANVRRLIATARRELFGGIGDAAIYKRLERARGLRSRPARFCQQAGCAEQLAVGAHGNRRFCDLHARPREHVRRHRERAREKGTASGA